MKVTKHACDLCGGQIKKHDTAGTLSVPLPKAKKAKGSPQPDAYTVQLFSPFLTTDSNVKTYDVCLACCEGLIRLAEAHKQALRASLEGV